MNVFRAWVVSCVIAAAVVLSAMPAIAQQPTPTPTPTETPAVLPTLEPVPRDGGRVAQPVTIVYTAPSEEAEIYGRLTYGSVIFPLGRDSNTEWVAVPWENQTGWIAVDTVAWHPTYDLDTLAVLVVQPTPAVSPTPTTPATATPPPPTASPPPPADETSAPSPTAEAAVAPTQPAEPPTAVPTPLPPEPTTDPGASGLPMEVVWGAVGIVGLAVVGYGVRFAVAQSKINRYGDGFVLDVCPVCQEGDLYLDETIRRTMGIPDVLRTVRCDTCRSVLRQVKPGVWRYAIDPMVNRAMAEDHHGTQVTDASLLTFATQAMIDYEPTLPDVGVERHEYPTPEEIIAELEAQALADEAAEQEEADTAEEEEEDSPAVPEEEPLDSES